MGQSFESEPHQNSLLCFQDGQLILLGLSQLPRLQIRHNCCFDLPQFPQFFSQVLILSIFSFSSTLASPGTSMSIIILANYLLFVYYNKVSSIVFKLMISLYSIKNHKGFDFLGLLNFSRDINYYYCYHCYYYYYYYYYCHYYHYYHYEVPFCLLTIVFWIQLEFRKADFWGEEKTRATGVPTEKPLGERERTSNKQIYTCLLIARSPPVSLSWTKKSMDKTLHGIVDSSPIRVNITLDRKKKLKKLILKKRPHKGKIN